MKTKLLINGIKVPVGHRGLLELLKDIEDSKENIKIFEAAVDSNYWEIKEYLSDLKSISKNMVKTLLKESRHGIITNILRNENARKFLNTKDILKIIKLNNSLQLCEIGERLSCLSKCNIAKIAKILSRHKDPSVRQSLVARYYRNCATPVKIVKKLTKDKDYNVCLKAKEALENM